MSEPTNLLTVSDINADGDGGAYKFVRMTDGEFRFASIDMMNGPTHKDLANEEKAIAAGLIFTFENHWRLEDSYSTTLQLSCGEEALEELKRLIDRPFRENY